MYCIVLSCILLCVLYGTLLCLLRGMLFCVWYGMACVCRVYRMVCVVVYFGL